MDSQSVKSGRSKLSLKRKRDAEKNSLPTSCKETQELPENEPLNVVSVEEPSTSDGVSHSVAECSEPPGEGLGDYFFCHICQKDLTRFNVARREQHINRCCDEEMKEKSKVAKDSEPATFVCVLCHKSFNSRNVRLTHMKSCARQKGISTTRLLELVRLDDTGACTSSSKVSQDNQASKTEPKKLKQQQLLPTLNKQLETAIKEEDGDFTMPPPQEPPKRRRKRKRQNLEQDYLQSVEDEQLQLALAMSASMGSNAGVVLPENLQETTGRKRKSSKKKAVKGAAVPPPLVTVTSEQVQTILAQRAEQILKTGERGSTINDDDDSIPCTPAFGTSDLAQNMLTSPALAPSNSCPTTSTKAAEENDDHYLFLSDTEDDRMSVADDKTDGCMSPSGVEDKGAVLTENDDIEAVSHSESACDNDVLESDTKSNDNVMSTSFVDVFQHLDYPTLWQLSASEGTRETTSGFYVPSLASFVPPSNIGVVCGICNTEPCLAVIGQQVSPSKLPAEDLENSIKESPSRKRNSETQSDTITQLYASESTTDSLKDSCYRSREASGREQLVSDLKGLVGSSFLSDVEITTKSGKVIPAHAVILGTRCSSIRKIVEESTTRPIPLDCSEFEDNVVRSFLHFIYTGSTPPTPSQHPSLSLLAQRWGVRELLVHDSEDPTQYYSGVSDETRLDNDTQKSANIKHTHQQSSDEVIRLQEDTVKQTAAVVPREILLPDNNDGGASERPDSPSHRVHVASNCPVPTSMEDNNRTRGSNDSEMVMPAAEVLSDDVIAPPDHDVDTMDDTTTLCVRDDDSSNSGSNEVCIISDVDEGANSAGVMQIAIANTNSNTENPNAVRVQRACTPEEDSPHSPTMVEQNVSQSNTMATCTHSTAVDSGSASVELSKGCCSETAAACNQQPDRPPCEEVVISSSSSASSSRMSSRATSHVSVSSTESAVLVMEDSPPSSHPTSTENVSEEHITTAAVPVTERQPFCSSEEEAAEDVVATCTKLKEVENIPEMTVYECDIQNKDSEECDSQEDKQPADTSVNQDDHCVISAVSDSKQTTDYANHLSCTLPLETAGVLSTDEVFNHSVDLFATPLVDQLSQIRTPRLEQGSVMHTLTTPGDKSALPSCTTPRRHGAINFKTPGETKSVQFSTPTEMCFSRLNGRPLHDALVTPVCDRTVLESDDNITPMPDYRTMHTPQLKKQCSMFGVKSLAKKKMIAKLEEIYDYTHPMVGEDGEIISAEEAVKEKPKTKTKKKPPAAKPKTKIISNVNEMPVQIDDETGDQEQERNDLKTNVINCIIADTQLYQDILVYKPLELSLIHTRLKAAGLNVARDKLSSVLDSLCITYTLPRHSSTGKKAI